MTAAKAASPRCWQSPNAPRASGLEGKVAISHAFALGSVPTDLAARTADTLAEAGIAIMSHGPGAGTMPPLPQLRAHGVEVFGGSDNIRDAWSPFGNGDMLERAMLIGYRGNFRHDHDFKLAYEMVTEAAARVLGIMPDYGIKVGRPADFVAVEAETLAEAVAARPRRKWVMKGGRVVARDGVLALSPRIRGCGAMAANHAVLGMERASFYYGSGCVFSGVSFLLDDARTALVGENGAGKSTLLKCLMGALELNGGKVIRSRGLRVGSVPQDVPAGLAGRSVRDVLHGALQQVGLATMTGASTC